MSTPQQPWSLPESAIPGLDGTYNGSCVCLRGTDTGLAFKGIVEWVLAGLRVLGVPDHQALAIVREATGAPPGMVPDGEVTLAFRVCTDCATACPASFVPKPIALGVPVVQGP